MAVKLGIKNVNQAIVFDLLTHASTWADPIRIDEKLYWWVSRQSICRELELLSMRPDTAYRHLKGLAELKLIDYKKDGKKDCIAITELGRSYIGNKSENTRKEIRKNSEINPIYHTSSDNTKDYHAEKLRFDVFRKKYIGKKRGLDTEFDNFKKHKDWEIVLPELEVLDLTLDSFDTKDKKFVPALRVFINQRRWEEILPEFDSQILDHKTAEENERLAEERDRQQFYEAQKQ